MYIGIHSGTFVGDQHKYSSFTCYYLTLGSRGINLAQILTCYILFKIIFQLLIFDKWHFLREVHLMTHMQVQDIFISWIIWCVYCISFGRESWIVPRKNLVIYLCINQHCLSNPPPYCSSKNSIFYVEKKCRDKISATKYPSEAIS